MWVTIWTFWKGIVNCDLLRLRCKSHFWCICMVHRIVPLVSSLFSFSLCYTFNRGAQSSHLRYVIRYQVKQGNRSFPLFSTSTIHLSTILFAASTYDPGAHPAQLWMHRTPSLTWGPHDNMPDMSFFSMQFSVMGSLMMRIMSTGCGMCAKS